MELSKRCVASSTRAPTESVWQPAYAYPAIVGFDGPVCCVLLLKRFMRLPAPQTSLELPEQAKEQSEAGAAVVGFVKSSPQ